MKPQETELRMLRIENERLLKLIQKQDILIRASDTASEIKLADALAEVLIKVDPGRSAPWGQHVAQVLNEWRIARNQRVENTVLDSGKRVS